MRPPRFPTSGRDRLRWAVGECLVLASILLVWIGVALLVQLALTVVGFATVTLGLEALAEPIIRVTYRGSVLWSAVTALALVTATLYVVVRAGTILIAHYRRPASE
jgi:hypothetical protein